MIDVWRTRQALLALSCLAAATPLCASTAGQIGGQLPSAQTPNSYTYYVYVAAESQDEVSLLRFDGQALTVVKKIPVGRFPDETDGPHGMYLSPTGQHWYVSLGHGAPYGVMQKFATETDTLVGEVLLDLFPSSLAVDPTGLFAFVANSNFHDDMMPQAISVVYTPDMAEVARVTTCTMPHGSRLNASATRHYSTCMMDDELVEIDTQTFAVLRKVRLGEGHAGRDAPTCSPTWAQPSPDERFVYVACNKGNSVVEIELATGKVTRRLETPNGPYNLDVTPDGRILVVTQKTVGSVTLWDLASGTMLAEISTGRRVTHGVTITPDGRYAFVSAEGIGAEAGSVDVVDIEKRAIVAHADVGKQAGGIAFWKMEAR